MCGTLHFSGGNSGKELNCQCRRHKRCGFDPWVGKIPWRRARQLASVICWRIPWTEAPSGLQSKGSQSQPQPKWLSMHTHRKEELRRTEHNQFSVLAPPFTNCVISGRLSQLSETCLNKIWKTYTLRRRLLKRLNESVHKAPKTASPA